MIRFEIIHFSIESSYKIYAYLVDLFEAEKFCTVLAIFFYEFIDLFLQLDLDYSQTLSTY